MEEIRSVVEKPQPSDTQSILAGGVVILTRGGGGHFDQGGGGHFD